MSGRRFNFQKPSFNAPNGGGPASSSTIKPLVPKKPVQNIQMVNNQHRNHNNNNNNGINKPILPTPGSTTSTFRSTAPVHHPPPPPLPQSQHHQSQQRWPSSSNNNNNNNPPLRSTFESNMPQFNNNQSNTRFGGATKQPSRAFAGSSTNNHQADEQLFTFNNDFATTAIPPPNPSNTPFVDMNNDDFFNPNDGIFDYGVENNLNMEQNWLDNNDSTYPLYQDYPQGDTGFGNDSYTYGQSNYQQTQPTSLPYQPPNPIINHNAYEEIDDFDEPYQQQYDHSRNNSAGTMSRSNTHYAPAPQSRNTNNNNNNNNNNNVLSNLRSKNEIPDRFRSIFKFQHFNRMQSQVLDDAFNSNNNLVVSSPTGSGKTVVMELAIIRLFMTAGLNAKVVYMAPTKALCNERANDWKKKFQHLGITCNELTGDTEQTNVSEAQRSNIIVTTPEKWDSTTRRWHDHLKLLNMVSLFLIDEVHVLHEAKRGATLEAVVSRMKTKSKQVRFVAISATVPNIRDIGVWLSNATVKVFGEEFRPVQLRREVLAFPGELKNAFQFDRNLMYKVMDVIETYSSGKPTLVFCSTRKSAMQTCEHLASQAGNNAGYGDLIYGNGHPFVKTREHAMRLKTLSSKFQEKKLGDLLIHGVGFHHAGLTSHDRNLLESAFLDNIVSVICTTTTLAVGVNLPAHLVIIKSTQGYENGKYVEYSDLDILQMLGRAGRPQFDDTGVAVIMTHVDTKDKYENMVSGKEIIESSLHENLIEHLNAEVVLGTIDSMASAIEWLKSSFLYVRVRANPRRYHLDTGNNTTNMTVEQRLESICVKDLEQLSTHGIIELSSDGKTLKPTELGTCMSKYYIKFKTMVEIAKMSQGASMPTVLATLCKAEEFTGEMRFQSGDKGLLNNVNKKCRFPIKGKVKTIDQKVLLYIQCTLGNISLTEAKVFNNVAQEINAIFNHAKRILRGIIDVCVFKKDSVAIRSSILLYQCLKARVWENSGSMLLTQLDGVGGSYATLFSKANITTFAKLETMDAREIEWAVSRNPPFGNKMKDALKILPKFTAEINQYKDLSKPTEIELFVNIGFANAETVRVWHKRMQLNADFVATTSDNKLLDFRRITFSKLKNGGLSFRFRVELTNPSQKIMCSLLSEDHVGMDIHHQIEPDINPIHFVKLAKKLAAQQVKSEGADTKTSANKSDAKPKEVLKRLDSFFKKQDTAQQGQQVNGDRNENYNEDDEWGIDVEVNDDLLNAAVLQAEGTTSSAGKKVSLENLFDDDENYDNIGNALDDHYFDDDLDLNALMEIDLDNVASESTTKNLPPKPQANTVPCKHFCKDKSKCSHQCCKTGVKRRRSTATISKDETDSHSIDKNPAKKRREIGSLENTFQQNENMDYDDSFTDYNNPHDMVKANPVTKTRPDIQLIHNNQVDEFGDDELSQLFSSAVTSSKSSLSKPKPLPDNTQLQSLHEKNTGSAPLIKTLRRKAKEEEHGQNLNNSTHKFNSASLEPKVTSSFQQFIKNYSFQSTGSHLQTVSKEMPKSTAASNKTTKIDTFDDAFEGLF